MSLKSQLLGLFLGFCLITTVTFIPMNIYYFKKKEEITSTVHGISAFRADLQHTLLLQSDFLNYDTRSTHFFQTNKSAYLDSLNVHQKRLHDEINILTVACKENKLTAFGVFQQINDELYANNVIFDKMVTAIYRRGFKDWGTEGQMRDQVHLLENFTELDQRDVLSLRRHEKDYIIRNDSAYVDKLNTLASTMRLNVVKNGSIKPSTQEAILRILSNYIRLFNKMVALDNEIGLRSKTGLNLQLLERNQNIEQLLSQIQLEIATKKEHLIREIEVAYIVSSIFLLLISITLGWLISLKFTRPINALTSAIKQLVKDDFSHKIRLKIKTNQREIIILKNEFNRMIEELHLHEEQRRKAQIELSISEKKYRDLTDWLPQGVFEVSSENQLTYANHALKDQFGLNDQDLNSGIRLAEIIAKQDTVHGDNQPASKHHILASRKNGSTFHALLYMNPINDKKNSGQRGLIIDISERQTYLEELKKEKAKAEESDKLKSAFLANMLHEIRTPMNAIIGFSEILKDPNLSREERDEFISHINTNGESLLNLIEDIIDIAKIESGHVRIERATTNLHEMFHELELSMNEVRKIHASDQVQLINDVKTNRKNECILTDPLRLRQILINLLTNALKFTDKGTVRFGYQVKHEQKTILFYVEDTGIGIPEDKTEIIFERFRKIHSNDTKHYRGTGLGLYISKTIINHLDGTIWVDSTIGEGSTFYFEIPYDPHENLPFNKKSPPQTV
ncbi:ATP-binding protein [Mangrovibacterium sp.]|uniref:sensor histidine kinase n=1 Tax=Mangrovibacterium sp. TaxID=1961364 RepID=UPI00356A17D6